MLFKLAYNNVKKSYQDFSVYFITLTLSVAIFYVFGSFADQAIILKLTQETETIMELLNSFMSILSGLTVVIFALLILYANKFLIRRRQKEIGLYLILGMRRWYVSCVLILETLFIGFVSLISGLFVGFVLSQITSVMIGNMLSVPIEYTFVFSKNGALNTVQCFIAIYLVVLLFNQRTLRKVKLNKLFYRSTPDELMEVKHIWLTVVLALLSLGALILAYLWALKPLHLFLFLPFIVGLGSFATFKLFKYTGILGAIWLQKKPRFYYKGLNMFIIRQVTSMFKESYKLMALVSITLLFGISVMTTGLTLNQRLDSWIRETNPYDVSMQVYNDEGVTGILESDFPESVKVRSEEIISVGLLRDEAFNVSKIIDVGSNKVIDDNQNDVIALVSIDDYNRLRATLNQDNLILDEGSAYIQPAQDKFTTFNVSINRKMIDKRTEFRINDVSIPLVPYDADKNEFTSVTNGNSDLTLMVAHDETLEVLFKEMNEPFSRHFYNFVLLNNGEQEIRFVSQELRNMQAKIRDNYASVTVSDYYTSLSVQTGTEAIATFSGIYIGFVLLIVSGVILSLQQLSQVNDSIHKYKALQRIGVDEKMINRAILRQCLIYFLIPLSVGLLHTVFGIAAINRNLGFFISGSPDLVSTLLTISMIILVYVVYFMMTFENSKQIVSKSKE